MKEKMHRAIVCGRITVLIFYILAVVVYSMTLNYGMRKLDMGPAKVAVSTDLRPATEIPKES